jgi:hypothetical protein
MVRRLLLFGPMLAAALAACSPAEPPLLIDGGQAPAAAVEPDAPSGEPVPASSHNEAGSR